MSGFLLSAGEVLKRCNEIISGVERPIFVTKTGFLQEMKDRKESRRVVKGSGELLKSLRVGCEKSFQSVKVVGAHMAANLFIDNGPCSPGRQNVRRHPRFGKSIRVARMGMFATLYIIRTTPPRYRIRSIFENKKSS